jgi:ribosome-associated protein
MSQLTHNPKMSRRIGQAGAQGRVKWGKMMLIVNDRIAIPLDEIDWSYARSGGPGGQNVNKVASKAVLRWPVTTSPSVPGDVRARFLQRFHTRITGDGDLVMASQEYRDQERNRQACLDRLVAMLLQVAAAPTPRKATRPTKGSKVRRVEAKKRAAKTKSNRKKPSLEE